MYRLLISILLAGLVTTSFAKAPTAAPAPATNTQPLHISFVQTASAGTLTAVPGQSNQYTLTLNNVSPYISYYIDRPSRATGLAAIKNFVSAWNVGNNSFAQDNPNAVIYAGQINGQPNAGTAYIVQISSPNYNAASNQMTYLVTPLGSQSFLLNQIILASVAVIIN